MRCSLHADARPLERDYCRIRPASAGTDLHLRKVPAFAIRTAEELLGLGGVGNGHGGGVPFDCAAAAVGDVAQQNGLGGSVTPVRRISPS